MGLWGVFSVILPRICLGTENEWSAILRAHHMVAQWLLPETVPSFAENEMTTPQVELFQLPDQVRYALVSGDSRKFIIFLCVKMWLGFCQRQCQCMWFYSFLALWRKEALDTELCVCELFSLVLFKAVSWMMTTRLSTACVVFLPPWSSASWCIRPLFSSSRFGAHTLYQRSPWTSRGQARGRSQPLFPLVLGLLPPPPCSPPASLMPLSGPYGLLPFCVPTNPRCTPGFWPHPKSPLPAVHTVLGESHRYYCSLSLEWRSTPNVIFRFDLTCGLRFHRSQMNHTLGVDRLCPHRHPLITSSPPRPRNVLWLFNFFLMCWHYNPVAQTRDFRGHVSVLIYPNFPCLGNRWDLTLLALRYVFKSMSSALSLISVSSWRFSSFFWLEYCSRQFPFSCLL